MHDTHILYRFYDEADQLLYIGITADPGARMVAHSHRKTWWSQVRSIKMQNFPNQMQLIRAERQAIKVENPLFNVVHSPRRQRRRRGWGSTATASPAQADQPSAQEQYWDWLVWQRWLCVSNPDNHGEHDDDAWKRWLHAAGYNRFLEVC